MVTDRLNQFYEQINFNTFKEKPCLLVSSVLLNDFKIENNLQHVKRKVYFKGLELKALQW